MNPPLFNKDIPVSFDKTKPNRYGYIKLSELTDYTIDFFVYDKKSVPQSALSLDEQNSLYILEHKEDTLIAVIRKTDHTGFTYYSYLGKELQHLLYKKKHNSNEQSMVITDNGLYLCIENYIDYDGEICRRYVVDIDYSLFTKWYSQEAKIEEEISTLIDFFKPKGFTHSSQVSNYIRMHRLGYQYPNISGFLKFQRDGEEWELEGAIAPRYFAEICERLELEHNKNAQPVNYESYKDRGIFD